MDSWTTVRLFELDAGDWWGLTVALVLLWAAGAARILLMGPRAFREVYGLLRERHSAALERATG